MFVLEIPPKINGPELVKGWWLPLAIGLLTVVILLGLGAWLRWRVANAAEQVPAVDRLRQDCLGELDRIAAEHRAARIDGAGAMRDLSKTLRAYASLRTGLAVDVMTLTELHQVVVLHPDLAPVAQLIDRAYRDRFSGADIEDAETGLSVAREWVIQWR